MYVTFIGIIIFIVALFFMFFTRTRTFFYFTFFISAFTATSMINLPKSNNSILAYYIVGSLFLLKVLYELIIKRYTFRKIRVFNGLLYFVIYAGISIVLPIFVTGDTLVFTPDGNYNYISFSLQNITQYLYLVFAFLIYGASYLVISNEVRVNIKKIFNITTVAVVVLGFIQFVLPHEYFDFVFRTNYSHMVQYLETGFTRISSVTNEPSMLSLFLTPLFAYYLVEIIGELKNKVVLKTDIIMLFLIFVICILNRSSSFYLVLLIIAPILVVDFYKDIFNKSNIKFLSKIFDKIIIFIKNNKIKTIIICLVLGILFLIVFKIVGYRFIILFTKLLGSGDSGSTRMELFSHHMGIFLKNLFTGVGFGTLRSNDLLSMWLAQVGFIGMIPLIYYFVSRLIYLFRNRQTDSNRAVFYLVISTVIVLITSVPEPYFIYTWIYIGLLEKIYSCNNSNNKDINNLKYKYYEIEQNK